MLVLVGGRVAKRCSADWFPLRACVLPRLEFSSEYTGGAEVYISLWRSGVSGSAIDSPARMAMISQTEKHE